MPVLRTLIAWPIIFLATVAASTSVVLIAPVAPRSPAMWRVARIWARVCMKVGGARRVKLVGAEHLQGASGVVLMANHESHLDPPTLIALSEPRIHFLTKHTLFYFPFFGWGLKAMGMISINRSNRERAFASIEAASDLVSGGKNVLIFPEGTRSADGKFLPFKKGGFHLAAHGGIPIVPIGLAGTWRVFPKGWHWLRSSDVVVVIGEPVDTSDYTVDDKEALMDVVRERIRDLRGEARRLLDAM